MYLLRNLEIDQPLRGIPDELAFRDRRARRRVFQTLLDALTPRERAELLAMQPQDRAKRLLELKAKLSASQPATQPSR